MNEDNPNNREKKVLIFHNQWLYGYTALDLNLRIMKRIKKGISQKKKCGSYGESKKDYINHYLERAVLKAVKFCSLQDIHNERDFHTPREIIFKDWENLGEELSREDNNNGFFICEIDKNLKLSYAFLSGLEDEDNIKVKTAEEYLTLFYDKEKQEEINKENKDYLNKILKGFLKFEGMNLFNISLTKDILNENKPDWYKEYKEGKR